MLLIGTPADAPAVWSHHRRLNEQFGCHYYYYCSCRVAKFVANPMLTSCFAVDSPHMANGFVHGGRNTPLPFRARRILLQDIENISDTDLVFTTVDHLDSDSTPFDI
jgi:hypothetical protein